MNMNCTSSLPTVRRLFCRFFTSQFAFRQFSASKNALITNQHLDVIGNFHWQIGQNNSFAAKAKGEEELGALEQSFGYNNEPQISSRGIEDRIFRVVERGLKEFNREWMMEASKNDDLLNNQELKKFLPKLEDEYGLEISQYYLMEEFLDKNVFGQFEKKHAIGEIEPSLEEQDPEERLAQKEYESLMLSEDRVRDPENEPDIKQMESGEETASKPINRFRKILIGDEFKNSDLTKPPSPENPHPFDPENCPMPPTHSRSLAPFANFSPLLQLLLHLGVDLYQAHRDDPALGNILINHVNFEEAKKKIYWLCKRVGIPEDELGSYLTRNPRFLVQEMQQLQSHLAYLQYRRFTKDQCRKLIVEYRYWLNHPIELIDGRLHWIQRQFGMRPDELRMVIIKEPRLIAFGTGPIGGIVRSLNTQCGFTKRQLKLIAIRDPRLFLVSLPQILTSYYYLAFVMRVTNEQIVEYPSVMRCHISGLKKRHEYLFQLRKANYVPKTADFISLSQFLHPSDRHFAKNVAKKSIDDYNKFLKQN